MGALADGAVAARTALVVVQGDAGAEHINHREAAVHHPRLEQRHQLRLVAAGRARDEFARPRAVRSSCWRSIVPAFNLEAHRC